MMLRLVPLLLLAAAPAIDAAEIRRGAIAVGERTSEQPALRAETAPGAGFRLGAAYRAWRNSAAAVLFDSDNTTGDGGDAEALAIDCGDERIAFATLEASRTAMGLDEAGVMRAAGDGDPAIARNWRARLKAAPAACH